jgi:hypothetical protein
MNNPLCAVCKRVEAVILIEAEASDTPDQSIRTVDYYPVCAECSNRVGDKIPAHLLAESNHAEV